MWPLTRCWMTVEAVICVLVCMSSPGGPVPPQKLTTPFTISPARCSLLVSAPERAPSNPRCCLRSVSAPPGTCAPDPSTATKKKKERRKKGSPPEFTLHPRITDAFFTHLRNLALEWTPPENIDRSDVSSTNWTFTVRKEISERGVQAEDGSLMWGREAETKDFLIQSCLLLNSSEKKKKKKKKTNNNIYIYIFIMWQCAMACMPVFLSWRRVSSFMLLLLIRLHWVFLHVLFVSVSGSSEQTTP